MRAGLVIALASALVSFGPASSRPVVKVAEISFDLLVGMSDRIVLARVDRIDAATDESAEKVAKELELAHATVLETWKGKKDEPLVYRCSRTWMCDITAGKVGEEVVLFLDTRSHAKYAVVMDAGRGRLPVTESNGEKQATLWVEDVELPLDTETTPGPEAQYDFIRNVKLDTLRTITKALVARRANLKEMVAKSDAVVFATIQRPRWNRLPRIVDAFSLEIDETWKGDLSGKSVEVRRPPSWPLDREAMTPGQRAVFFLTKPRADGSRDLVEDGRGRMVLEWAGDRRMAKVWIRDVEVPPELPVEEVLDSKKEASQFWGYVRVLELQRFVADVH